MSSYNLKTPRCQHVKDNGIQCGSPALRRQSFCYQHNRIHNCKSRPGDRGYLLPALEGPLSVTIAAVQIAQAAHDGKITLPLAKTMLYAIQLAAPYACRGTYTTPSEITIDLPPAMQQLADPCGADTPVREDPQSTIQAQASITEASTQGSSINNNQSPINNSEVQVPPPPSPEQVRAYWTQHLPPEVANLRSPTGSLIYEPPDWVPLTPEEISALQQNLPPDGRLGTPQQEENLDRLSRHSSNGNVKPPRPEDIIRLHQEAWKHHAEGKDTLAYLMQVLISDGVLEPISETRLQTTG